MAQKRLNSSTVSSAPMNLAQLLSLGLSGLAKPTTCTEIFTGIILWSVLALPLLPVPQLALLLVLVLIPVYYYFYYFYYHLFTNYSYQCSRYDYNVWSNSITFLHTVTQFYKRNWYPDTSLRNMALTKLSHDWLVSFLIFRRSLILFIKFG